MTLLSFVLPFLIFISFPSRLWNFDGVACAAALELGNPLFFFHSNHMLYGFFGFLFWQGTAHWMPRALPALQLFTSLLSAAGLLGVYLLTKKVLTNERLALLLTLGLSLSAVVWVWSVEAQVYALGFLALSWATYALIQPEHPKKWITVGALHAGAVLGHVVHVLWLAPALYWMWAEKPRARGKKLRDYLLTLSLVTAIPYALVIGFLIVPRHWNDRWLFKWLMGSAALNPTSVFEWHSAGWAGPLQWAGTTLRIFWGSFWPYQTTTPAWGWALTLISAAALGALGVASFKAKGRLWVFSLLWLAVYGVFFWTWEPRTECYRMTDLIPLGLLLAIGAKALPGTKTPALLLGVNLLCLLPLNLVTRIAPMNDVNRNRLYQETVELARITREDSLYLTLGGPPWIYLLYFSGRSAWNLNSLMRDPVRLKSEISRHLSTRPVYIRAEAYAASQATLPAQTIPLVEPSLPWRQLK